MNRYKDFEPTPFWFLNDTFREEEIIKQLDTMQQNGIYSFILHARDGNLNEAYGTAVYFEHVKFIVEQAAKRSMKVWLYDEDSYPSGNAGGSIAIERPELTAYSLKVVKIKPSEISDGIARRVLGRVKGLFGYAVCKTENGEKSVKITDCFGPLRRKWYRRETDKTYYCDMQNKLFFKHVRAGTFYPEIAFETHAVENAEIYVAYLEPVITDGRYGLQADCLNRETTEEFINRTHEKYAEHVGEYFGNVIPAIFMDEPLLGGLLPYTKEAEEKFKVFHGYDITDYYYKLSSEYTGDGKKVRREYIETITALFTDNFITPISEWCERHGILLTGHFYGEEDPLSGSLCAQSVYRQTKLMGIPGFDIIGRYVGDLEHCALILGAKIVVSAAEQSGKERILAECFALNPFNFGYDALRKTGDWLFVLGINLLVPHAFYYGYGAYQRTDAGKSFFFQDTLFSEYINFSHYAGRVCKLLCDYKHSSDVLLVYPSCGFAEEVPFPMGNNGVFPGARAVSMQKRTYAAVRCLIENQIGFDVSDVASVLNSEIKDGRIKIDGKTYEKAIVIRGGEKEDTAFKKLSGGGVGCILSDGEDIDRFIKPFGLSGNNKNIILYKKYGTDSNLILLYQNSADFAEITVPVGENTYCYDAEKGEYLKVFSVNKRVTVGIKGYGLLILITGKKVFDYAGDYSYVVEGRRIIDCEENPEWVYMPEGAGYAITDYDIQVSYLGKTEKFKKHKYSRIRELIGTQDDIYRKTYIIPYFDIAKRPKPLYPCKAVYCADVPYIEGFDSVLFDCGTFTGEYKLLWNGEIIDKNQIKKHRVYDAENYVFKPKFKKKRNRLTVYFENAGEFDGVNGEIYLYGDKKTT